MYWIGNKRKYLLNIFELLIEIERDRDNKRIIYKHRKKI